MPQPLSGPGVGLPIPQNLYPSELANAPYDTPTNYLTLPPGDALPIPAGDWYIDPGKVGLIQYLDPVTGIWRTFNTARGQLSFVKSDGFTSRIANLTGCPIAAIVQGGGSGYVQASTTCVASVGASTWQPIVGGQCSVVSVTNAGANYTLQPLVFIPAPPAQQANGVGGVQATAVANISAGTVSGITLTNVGAGYITAPTPVILPNPADPTISTITQATVTFGLTSSGKISAVLCTNNGAPQAGAVAPTLTIAGAGIGATVAAVMMQSVQSASISGAGVGYSNGVVITTVGGVPSQAEAFTNPAIELTAITPRPAQIGATLTATSLTAVGTIYDPGLFDGTPTALVLTGGAVTTPATVLLTMGGVNETILLQPAP